MVLHTDIFDSYILSDIFLNPQNLNTAKSRLFYDYAKRRSVLRQNRLGYIISIVHVQRTYLYLASQYLREIRNQRYNPQAEQNEYHPHYRADILCLLLEYFQDNP